MRRAAWILIAALVALTSSVTASEVNLIQTNFTAGEISPQLFGRVDLAKYFNAAAEMTNVLVRVQGGATRRPGTEFIAEAKYDNRPVRLVPFEFSTDQAYILEFGDEYIRFYMNGGQITDGGSPYEIESPYGYQDLDGLQFAQSADVLYIVHPDYPPRKLSRTGHTNWTLTEVLFEDGPYLERNETDIGIHPYGYQVGDEITLVASGSLFKQDHVGAIFRIGQPGASTTKQFTGSGQIGANLRLQGTFYADLTPDLEKGWDGRLTLQLTQDNAVSWHDVGSLLGSETRVFDEPKFGNYYRLQCKSGDYGEGRCRGKLYQHTAWGYVRIVSVQNGNVARGVVVQRLRSTLDKTTQWHEGAWSPLRGYPSAVGFHEQRLCFANNRHKPQTLWASRTDDFEHFSPGSLDDSPLSFTLADQQVNAIRWIRSIRGQIVCGTGAGVWILGPSSSSEPLTPENVKAAKRVATGVSPVPPVQTDSLLVFLQRAGRKVHALEYAFDVDDFETPDLSILAEHITAPGISAMAYQQEPNSTVWMVRKDGALLSMTYLRRQQVVSWCRHVTDGAFESVAVIPAEGEYELWTAVRRDIGGNTRRYVERFRPLDWGDDPADAFFVDSGLTYDGAPATVISGLDHLEAETVAILADGAAHPQKTVSGGQVVLDRPASKVHIGLPYTSVIRTLRPEVHSDRGTTQGLVKRIFGFVIRFHETLGCKVGETMDALETLSFRRAGDPMDEPPALYSGDFSVSPMDSHDTDATLAIVQDQPLPLTILALITRMEVGPW